MAEFNRAELRKIFAAAEIEVPKDVLGQLCDLHSDASDGVAESIKDLKKQLKTAEHERDEALAKVPKDGEETVSKAEHDKVVKELADLKNANAAKETKAAKEKALKAYLTEKSIKDGNQDIALMACGSLLDSLELDGEKFKDTKALDDLVGGKLASLVTSTRQKGNKTPTPPNNSGKAMTKEDIAKIKDPAERRAAIAANIEVFDGKGDE